jgi:CTP synthase (UTP-ammonia lyase)
MNEAPLRIVIVGEFDPGLPSHRATNDALNHAADYLSVVVEHSWLPSSALAENRSADALKGCDGLWAAPGGPYRSIDGVFSAIRLAREQDWPYFAT